MSAEIMTIEEQDYDNKYEGVSMDIWIDLPINFWRFDSG
jgi:hypothetical protein